MTTPCPMQALEASETSKKLARAEGKFVKQESEAPKSPAPVEESPPDFDAEDEEEEAEEAAADDAVPLSPDSTELHATHQAVPKPPAAIRAVPPPPSVQEFLVIKAQREGSSRILRSEVAISFRAPSTTLPIIMTSSCEAGGRRARGAH